MRRLLAAMLICASVIAVAEAQSKSRRNHASRTTPGNFDYYLLTLSWGPDYCAMPNANRNSRECASGNHVGFVVHGLWPQFDNGGYPEECAPASPVASSIVNQTLAYIPDAGLIQHEWKEHGTCSGLDPATYFGLVRQAADSVKIPDQYKTLNHTIQVSPVDVEVNFGAANASFPMGSVRVGCGGGTQLSDVRICFTKDLQTEACPATVTDCNANTITMLPEK